MNINPELRSLLFSILFLACGSTVFAQDDGEEEKPVAYKKSRILTGLYVGSYFANKYTASAYNGYGIDADGNRNTFLNSLMYQKIINEYGGGYGQYDQVAQAIGVDQRQWAFTEGDMPTNMHYVPAIMVGFNFKIPIDKTSAIIFNLNGSKLGIEGNFTITTLRPQNPNPALNTNVKILTIKGAEQRLLFQLGYQHKFGGDDKFNFFGEIGVNGTLAKFDRNTVYINDLQIDLMNYVNQTLYPAVYPTRRRVGLGIGAFAGLGANFEMNPKFTLQFLYSASHERVKIGENPSLKLQHALGLRIYYKI